jgi:hypothetical protein
MKKLLFHLLTTPFWTGLSLSSLVVQNYHTDNWDMHWSGTWYKLGKSALTSCHRRRKTKPFHLPTKKNSDTTKQTLAHWRKEDTVLYKLYQTQRNKNKAEVSKMQCAGPCFKLYHTKMHFWRLTLKGKMEHVCVHARARAHTHTHK